MNASRMIINLARRSYATRIRKSGKKQLPSNPGIQNRLNVLEEEGEKDFESIDPDFGDEEPDFSRVDESYTAYKREQKKSKEVLKLRIVARKYFKTDEPSLLTFMEKEQIRYLNSTNPLEYTPEKLSESFPSLPHTIRKVIKAKWQPRNADRVLKHDQQVIENWKKFERGDLALEPRLREHLEGYKNRKISLPNREEVEQKLIPPKLEYAKPTSQLYSGIIQSYLEREKDQSSNDVTKNVLSVSADCNDDVTNDEKEEEKQFDRKYLTETYDGPKKSTVGSEVAIEDQIAVVRRTKLSDRMPRGKNQVTMDEFFKQEVQKIGDTPSLEEQVLLDTYKRKLESDMAKAEEPGRGDRSSSRKFDPSFKGGDSVTLLEESDLQTEIEDQNNFRVVDDSTDVSKEFGLDTYVKAWEKKACDEEYPESIKIPKNKYQKGKIYQLRDCYYDDDGEFLFRVPGFKA